MAGLALASTAWNLGQTQREFFGIALLPDDPDLTFSRALYGFRVSGDLPNRAELADIKRAARLDPLEDEPFLFSALDRLEANDGKSAIAKLEIARHRNPRTRETRILLLDSYRESGAGQEAIGEIDALSWLLPGARETLIDLVVELVSRPETRKSAGEALSRSPLRLNVLQKLARINASPYMLLELATGLKGAGNSLDEWRWIDSIVQPYVGRGDLEGARLLWRHFHAIRPRPVDKFIFDGDLDGLAGPPFGWKIESGAAGLAQLKDGTLSIQHFGRDNIVFARQLVTLSPGAYALDFSGHHDQKERANLVWRIDCVPSGATLLEMSLNPSGLFETASDNRFEVPDENCQGQWIALTGRPMEFPETRVFRLEKVGIRQVEEP